MRAPLILSRPPQQVARTTTIGILCTASLPNLRTARDTSTEAFPSLSIRQQKGGILVRWTYYQINLRYVLLLLLGVRLGRAGDVLQADDDDGGGKATTLGKLTFFSRPGDEERITIEDVRELSFCQQLCHDHVFLYAPA